MNCYKEEYGADADGNRGVTQWECELEDSDKYDICEQLLSLLEDNGCLENDERVYMINPYNDEIIEFTVRASEWLRML